MRKWILLASLILELIDVVSRYRVRPIVDEQLQPAKTVSVYRKR